MENVAKRIKNKTFIKFIGIYTELDEKIRIEEQLINNKPYDEFIPKDKIKKYKKQYIKDLIYVFLYKIKLRKRAAKLVGLAFGVWKEDYVKINGFDENYEGWGYEDDDFGNRLTALGICGVPFCRSIQ